MLASLDALARVLYAPVGEFLLAQTDSHGVPAGSPRPVVEAQSGSAGFDGSRAQFEAVVGFLAAETAGALTHSELENRLAVEGRELLRLLLQDHLDVRAAGEQRVTRVVDDQGVPRRHSEAGHKRALGSVFGEVTVTRVAYRARGTRNRYPADAMLNLPLETHSHGLRELAAVEASRGSYDDAIAAIARATGQDLGKRQVEALAARAAVDFEAFYAQRTREPAVDGDVIVLSCDGKGVVMRPGALRPATAKAAATQTRKLHGRLSKGEKRGRKRMAEVGTVYETQPAPRTIADILATNDDQADQAPGPRAKNKWLTASVVDDAAQVVAEIFREAERRDPDHTQTWIALVDGNQHQIDRINAEAAARQVTVTILIDIIHVLEYLWGAAWCLHPEGDPRAEAWVHRQAQGVLNGNATSVAGQIRRAATNAKLDTAHRKNVDACATYLTNKQGVLDYPTALQAGWPIATGVIEGACRHLIKDRMDLTGARWGLQGAEAILKLRALRSNQDFDEYWKYHLAQEHQRVHQSRYADNAIPNAA